MLLLIKPETLTASLVNDFYINNAAKGCLLW